MLPLIFSLAVAAGPSGQIAYLAGESPEAYRVHVRDFDTGEATPIGFGEMDGPPIWSPDGVRLAFETGQDGARAIAYSIEGAPAERVPGAGNRRSPAWSADGRHLAYALGEGLETRVAVYDLDEKRETVWGGDRPGVMRPAWLPDNQLLVALAEVQGLSAEGLTRSFADVPSDVAGILAIGFVPAGRRLSTDILIVTPTDTYPLPDSAVPSKGDYAEWNVRPHLRNRGVAFESDDGGDREIFVTTLEGSSDISNHRAADWNPVWQMKGSWLAFESFRDGRRGVYRVHRDADRVYPVAGGEDFDAWGPSWERDGDWLVYVSNEEGAPALYARDVEGGGKPIRITTGNGPEEAPAWRPDP